MIVAAIAVGAPMLVGLFPRIRVPAVVLEIVAGIVVGPHGFEWVSVDLPIQILGLFGLAFLLFLAGLEIDPSRLGGDMRRIVAAFVVSAALALALGGALVAWIPRRAAARLSLLLAVLGVLVLGALWQMTTAPFDTPTSAYGWGFWLALLAFVGGTALATDVLRREATGRTPEPAWLRDLRD